MATAIVSGAIANKPFSGGEAWVRLSWVLGLQRLGFDVYFVEQLADAAAVDGEGRRVPFFDSANLTYFEQVIGDFGLEGKAGLLDGNRAGTGLGPEDLVEVAANADVLFNLSGQLTAKSILDGPGARVYVDLDPVFTQAWHNDESTAFRLGGHDHYVTVGLNVGGPNWPLPAGGIEWIGTLPPVVLTEWPDSPVDTGRKVRFTTVGTWRSPFGGPEIDGRPTTLKHHQMRRIFELPERVEQVSFEIALDIHQGDSADLDALRRHGWRVVDPRSVAGSPASFRRYLRESTAELSVAQGAYVEAASGWFSDRTAAYLASGRAAVIQETGVGDAFPVGAGLFTFSTLDEAVERVAEVATDPGGHGRAARELAERHLDSDLVLERLLSTIGVRA
jgi:hypothetical protein